VNLGGRSVLLTGATGGIGHAIARRLSREGARLVLTGRRADVLEPLAAELDARALAVDLADAAEVERLATECAGIDVLVANAALPASGHLNSFSVEEIDRALAVNLRAPMMLARALSESMVARGEGHLVFISSLAGKAAVQGSTVYSATKFGLRGFGQGLRDDLRAAGVGVSVVFPGFIRDAGMYADAGVQLPGFIGTSTPEQVADAVVRAIVRNKGEVDVAPVSMRLGAKFAGLAPELAANANRRMGGEHVAAEFESAQLDKR